MTYTRPQQPTRIDEHGVLRFVPNRIIEWAVDTGRIDLNEIMTLPFDDADRCQLAQLIGYSVSGYGDLDYVTNSGTDQVSACTCPCRGECHT